MIPAFMTTIRNIMHWLLLAGPFIIGVIQAQTPPSFETDSLVLDTDMLNYIPMDYCLRLARPY